MNSIMRVFGFIGALATAALVTAGIYVAGGWYDFGADSAHWKISEAMIETVRDRSIARRSDGIDVPDLTDQQLILKGAGQYAAMCTQCHLSPIDKVSDIRPGLYPQPPELSKIRVDPREAFWVTKHGIKMTAMPAWGRGHDDATIWSIVAFVNKLPDLSADEYRKFVAMAPPDGHGDAHSESQNTKPPPATDGHSHQH